MRLLSLNVSLPKTVTIRGKRMATGIFKEPVPGPLWLGKTLLEGDGQGDLVHHGGADKACYFYSATHYESWRKELGRSDLPFGYFGENFTVEGLAEDSVSIGDRIRIGGALVEISQPRQPCFKLAWKVGEADFPAKFLASGRTGFYARVLEEGRVRPGDAVEIEGPAAGSMTVAAICRLKFSAPVPPEAAALAATLPGLSEAWRTSFRQKAPKNRKTAPPALK